MKKIPKLTKLDLRLRGWNERQMQQCRHFYRKDQNGNYVRYWLLSDVLRMEKDISFYLAEDD